MLIKEKAGTEDSQVKHCIDCKYSAFLQKSKVHCNPCIDCCGTQSKPHFRPKGSEPLRRDFISDEAYRAIEAFCRQHDITLSPQRCGTVRRIANELSRRVRDEYDLPDAPSPTNQKEEEESQMRGLSQIPARGDYVGTIISVNQGRLGTIGVVFSTGTDPAVHTSAMLVINKENYKNYCQKLGINAVEDHIEMDGDKQLIGRKFVIAVEPREQDGKMTGVITTLGDEVKDETKVDWPRSSVQRPGYLHRGK